MRRFTRGVSGRHDCEGGDVGDSAHRGRADPGAAEDAAEEVDEAEQDDVQVEAVALLARPVHHDQSAKNTITLYQLVFFKVPLNHKTSECEVLSLLRGWLAYSQM